MAKKLVFHFNDADVAFEMNKIDRSKLYGFKELEVVDDSGDHCELATLAGDGKTLIGKGGTGIGYLTADGHWSDKTQLTPVDLEGDEITPVKSSFSAPIDLADEVTPTEFLNHNIRLIYRLESEEALPESLVQKLEEGTIFQFDYSYRGGLEADHGFLLTNEAKEIFFLVGDATSVEFIGLQQAAPVAAEEEASPAVDDLMDFGMI